MRTTLQVVRFFISILYQGAAFHGWQRQPEAVGVQQVLEEGLSLLLKEPITTVGAGRTDVGVHATGQVAHFDCSTAIADVDSFLIKLNGVLPPAVSVKGLYRPTHPDRKPELHARFSALDRAYAYTVLRHKHPLLQNTALQFHGNLNPDALQEAASVLREYEDFASFCKAGGTQHTTLCTVYESFWHFTPEVWTYRVRANRFLRGMVRALVGTQLLVAKGDITLAQFRALIEARDRTLAGPNAAAKGLCLAAVTYPAGSLTLLAGLPSTGLHS